MRTRDEQVNDLVEALWDGMCRKDAEKAAYMIIDEAMALGAAAEREQCAKVCESLICGDKSRLGVAIDSGARDCAEAIRSTTK